MAKADGHDADVAETRDLSSPAMRAGSSGIPLHDNVISAREKGSIRPAEVLPTCLTEGAAGIAVRDGELRVFCRRLLGPSEARSVEVDDAIDGVISAVARGLPIALRGTSDLVPVAYALHRRIVGADRPFVVCDPRRREVEGSVRAPPNRRTIALALESAMDGSICLRSRRLPADFDRLRESGRNAAPFPTVFICLHRDDRVRDLLCRPLEIPPLAARASESHRLLQEAMDEAATALGTARVPDPAPSAAGDPGGGRLVRGAREDGAARRRARLHAEPDPGRPTPWDGARVIDALAAPPPRADGGPGRAQGGPLPRRRLNASSRFGRNHMEQAVTIPTPEPGARMHPFDAFERICYEVLELEALANAPNAAIDECAPPSESRRSFDRAQALIGNAAEKAAAAVALIDELKIAVNAYVADRV
jgi:hypothetical protein